MDAQTDLIVDLDADIFCNLQRDRESIGYFVFEVPSIGPAAHLNFKAVSIHESGCS